MQKQKKRCRKVEGRRGGDGRDIKQEPRGRKWNKAELREKHKKAEKGGAAEPIEEKN